MKKIAFRHLFILLNTICCIPVIAQTQWSVATANSFIEKYPDPDSIHWFNQKNHFDWQAGYNMFVMEKLWKATGDVRYFNYVKRYVDQQVDSAGNIPGFKPDALDHFIPGYAILFMYEQTHKEKYKVAAQTIFAALKSYPRNSDGSFWHSTGWARNQMWVDGVFMGQIFTARYGKVFSDTSAFNEVTRQMKLIVSHCQKPNGLLLHAWDESRKAKWADQATGLAPEVWSEGLGWYAVLIADVFDFLPKGHPDYPTIMNHLKKLCNGLKNSQDPKTGMWCQVVDKPEFPDNWTETSGTGMFLYLLKKSIEKGYIDRGEYEPIVKKAYAGIITKARINEQKQVDILQCSSIGVQESYAAYVNQPKEVNTFAAISSFILGTASMEHASMFVSSAMQQSPDTIPGNGLSHFDFFYAGEAKKQNMYIVRNGKIAWSYTHTAPKGEISDAVMLSNGNILFAHQFGITEITPGKKVVWNYDAPEGTEIHTAAPIGKERVLFLRNGNPAKLIVINKTSNAVEKELILPVGNPNNIHGHFRHARLTKAGTILVAHLDMGRLCEYDSDGKELLRIDVPGIWSAEELTNGNILIVGRNAVKEINRKLETIWEYPFSLAQGYVISSPQTAFRLSNGNTIINNWFNQWNGSGKVNLNNQPVQAIEVTPDKKIVWALREWAAPNDLGPSTTIIPLSQPRTDENVHFGSIH